MVGSIGLCALEGPNAYARSTGKQLNIKEFRTHSVIFLISLDLAQKCQDWYQAHSKTRVTILRPYRALSIIKRGCNMRNPSLALVHDL